MPTLTPNVGLQIPDLNQPNWQVPINYDLNRLDLIFGGEITVPALSVGTLTFTTAAGLASLLISSLLQEQPTGSVPGSVYTTSRVIGFPLSFTVNGLAQRFGIDYTVSGNTLTTNFTTTAGDKLWLVYAIGS